jgi:hypothetical protein
MEEKMSEVQATAEMRRLDEIRDSNAKKLKQGNNWDLPVSFNEDQKP